MLSLSANMALALVPARSASDSISRDRSLLFEIYETDHFPDEDGLFDPADAIARWAKHDCAWLGNLYEGRIFSYGELSEFISGQFNSITLTIENADRYLQQFTSTNVVDGLRLVIRYVNWDHSASLEDSRQWVLRLQAPDNSELDREQGDLTAKEELATLDCEIPKGTVAPEDPEGRSPNDILNEGFPFNAHQSMVKYNDPVTSTKFGIFPRKKDQIKYNQWSSVSETDGAVVPLIASGRVQLQGLPVFWFDQGFYIIGIWLFGGHKVTSITNFLIPEQSYIFYGWWNDEAHRQTHVHLGDPGGTGTNATPDTIESTYPENAWYGSRKAYTGFAIGGPESENQPFANPQMDAVPTLVGVVRVEHDLPDESGVFNQKGYSDSPPYAARFVLTSPDFFGLDSRLINDSNLPAVHAERQRPIIDKSNGEFLALMEHDLSALIGGTITRLSSTGLIDSRYFRHLLDSGQPDPLVTNRDDVFAVSVGGEGSTGGDQQLTDGVTLTGQSVTAGNWKYYYIESPIGATELQVVGTGAGDATLFTRQGSKPTTTEYDCTDGSASPQSCIHDNPTSGRWWIGVHGNSGATTFTILAVVFEGMVGNVLPAKTVVRKAWTLNLPLTDTVNAVDFLNNVVLPAGRLYRVTDTAGRQDIRAKKASDSAYLISDASAGTAATGNATLDTLPANGDTLTLNGVSFTFKTVPTGSTDIPIGATVNATVDSAVTLLNASTDPLISVATYSNGGSGVLLVTYDEIQYGSNGNAYTLAKVSTHITLSGSALSGGLDGDTSVLIANVEPWRASQRGYLLINPGLTTSEYREITSAEYHPATGDSITLAVSGTGLTASGATLSGGSTSLPSSGTVTVSSASGDVVIGVWGIPVTYTVTANDIDDSVAAMLATLINADPDLNQYVRAEWEQDDVVHIYSTVGKLIFATALLNDHESQVDSPVAEPTASATGSGTLDPGSYYLGYSLVDGSGSETLMSPLKKIMIASGEKVSVASLGTLPTGAAEVNWYFSPAVNDDHVQFWITNSGGAFTINNVADYDADYPPTVNQTGGETIRVAEVFNQFNIRHGSFKWVPAVSKINQTSGEYVDAANGFKRTKVTVNDRAHQRAIKQTNKKEINFSGVDNFSQASRLCYATLAEERDGGAGCKLTTDDAGIALEIGDVVAVNDYRWNGTAIENYLVNQPIFITERTLQEDFDVSITGKVYSSSLLEGQIGRKPIVIPTTLKYLTEAPPVATNLVVTINANTLTGFLVDFDFGSTAGSQRALILKAGPSDTEPDSEDFQLLDTVTPDAINHGHLEVRAATMDKYWIKVVTQSQFGQSATSGHPIEMIDLRPYVPENFLCFFDDPSGDALEEWASTDPRLDVMLESYDLEQRNDDDDATIRALVITPEKNRHLQEYVIWDPDSVGGGGIATFLPDGGYSTTTTATSMSSKASAEVVGGFLLEIQIPTLTDYIPGGLVALYPEDRFGLDDIVNFSWEMFGDYPIISARPEAAFAGEPVVAPTINIAPGDRLGIYMRPDGVTEYHLNYTPMSKPIWLSPKAVQPTKRYFAYADGGAAAKVSWLRQGAEYKYTAAAQWLDRGLTDSDPLPSTIKARVRARPTNAGSPSDWVNGVFTR